MDTPHLFYTHVMNQYAIDNHMIYINKENDHNGKPDRVSVIFRYRTQEDVDYSQEEIEKLRQDVSEILRLPVGRAVYDPKIRIISLSWDYNQRMPDVWGIPDAMIKSDDNTIFKDVKKAILRLTRPIVKWSVITPDKTIWECVETRWDEDNWVVRAISAKAGRQFTIDEWQSLEELTLPFA